MRSHVVTAVVTVSVGLIVAVVIDMAVSGIFVIRSLSRAIGVRREQPYPTRGCPFHGAGLT